MWLITVVLILVAFAVCTAGAVIYGSSRWKTGTAALRARLESGRRPIETANYGLSDIAELPPTVQRYFRAVLHEGQPVVAAARISHEGQFNLSESGERWSPFTSTQFVITRRPGFDWDGRIRMAPGMTVFVHDAYVRGEGILHAALLGLVTLADLHGTPEAAQGELMRFFAEAAWYPTALLPSQGVSWQAVDDASSTATLTDEAIAVSLEFRFDAAGLIDSVRTKERYRTLQNTLVATPWQGRFWAYEIRDGMRIPSMGEVAWQLPDGPHPYWRGRLTAISYEFAR